MALPAADVRVVLEGRRALILAPHADDESLGCGGLIAAACAAGIAPVVVILTDGAASHPGSRIFPPARLREVREAEARYAVSLLGLPAENLYFLRYPDTKLPAFGPEFITAVEKLLEITKTHTCAVVIGPWAGDQHGDHRAAARMAYRVAYYASLKLLSYPVWGWLRVGTDMWDEPRHSGWRLNISAYLRVKRKAIAAHQSQYRDLIQDSPNGFRLPTDLLVVFERPFEVFIA